MCGWNFLLCRCDIWFQRNEISPYLENDYYHPACIHAVDQSPLLLFFLIHTRIKPVPNIIHHLKQRKGISSLLWINFRGGVPKWNWIIRIIPWLPRCVLHIVWALYYIHIVLEVTMNMAEYTSSWQSAAGAAEECQYLNFEEDLKMILF